MSISPEHTCISICPAPRTRNRMPNITGRRLRRKAHRHSAPSLTTADDDSFAAAVAGPLPVLVYLSAPWCEPCRLAGVTVQQAASDFDGRLKVVTVNVDGAPATAQRLGVQTVPTLVVLQHGRELARRVGALPAAALYNWLGAVLQAASSRIGTFASGDRLTRARR
jgi:thioredoxin 2